MRKQGACFFWHLVSRRVGQTSIRLEARARYRKCNGTSCPVTYHATSASTVPGEAEEESHETATRCDHHQLPTAHPRAGRDLTVGLIVTVGALALAHRLPAEALISLGVTSVIGWAGAGAYVLVALLALIGGVALLLMRPWAWTLAMLLEGYALALALWSFSQGHPLYLQMLLSVAIVFYLNTRDVYRAFQARLIPQALYFPMVPMVHACL